jgi:uncharacterized protein (DUF1684 family)
MRIPAPSHERSGTLSRSPLVALLTILALAAAGCEGRGGREGPEAGAPSGALVPPSAHGTSADPYLAAILKERRLKDDFFRGSPESPVPAAERARFSPLDYYPVDPTWRLELTIEPYAHPQTFTLVTNLGEKRVYRREGQVRFTRDGVPVSLQLYREIEGAGESPTLWVPFTDAGAGRETYPAGRYMDVEPSADARVVLDFNRAYNPYCAYGWAYSCPMAPPENRLKIAVRAGERGYPKM